MHHFLDQRHLCYVRMLFFLYDGYRLVFNLFALEGYSHKEIGEKLGIAESSSRSQFARARQLLIQKIKELYKDQDTCYETRSAQ